MSFQERTPVLIDEEDNGKHRRRGNKLLGKIKTQRMLLEWFRRHHGKSFLLIIAATTCCAYWTFSLFSKGTASERITIDTNSIVPPCDTSPWKPNENLHGQCPGTNLTPHPTSLTIHDCATSCCQNTNCITWQFRRDVGCLQGNDVRLGMEKDGVAAWCSEHPPQRWQGQYLIPHKQQQQESSISNTGQEIRTKACNELTWNPNEQTGQCFGLGDVKPPKSSSSALECMRACCADDKCGAWQYNKLLGCFYSSGMYGCQGGENDSDLVKFEPFVGRRKFMEGRTYVDTKGKPWHQTLE